MKTNNYLTTKEFIKAVEELGFYAEERGDEVYLYGRGSNGLAKISKKFKYTINTFYREFMDLNSGDKGLLFDLIIEYISTPIEEREEVKKCHWQHRWMDGVNGNFLNLDLEDDYLYLDDKKERWYKKTQFTLKEIEEIKKKFDTDLADFEIVEVEE